MARKRKEEYAWLPKYFYVSKGRIVYQQREDGKYLREHTLCKSDIPKSRIFSIIEKYINRPPDTLEWLINQYFQSSRFAELSYSSKKSYYQYQEHIVNLKVGLHKRFGDVRIIEIKRKTIRQYLDKYPHKISANRHIQFLKAIFNWGRERFDEVKDNPCEGVRLNKEVPRTRYIEDWEYELVLKIAHQSSSSYIPLFMELSYLCRGRFGEIQQLKRDCIKERGVFLNRSKGSRNELTLWTPRLEKAVLSCKKHHPNRISSYLIHNKNGLKISRDAFQSAWQRLMEKSLKNGLKKKFTFHDIKAKGISDHKDKAGGHKSEKMRDVYDRIGEENQATR